MPSHDQVPPALHKPLGIAILVLALIRLAVRLR
jgi:cytochrome b561